MTLAYLSLPQFPYLGHEAVVAHPLRRLHPCNRYSYDVLITTSLLRTSSIRSGRSASPAVSVGRSKQAICRTENSKRMPCGAIASYPEQSYARSKALHCSTAERIESAGQRGTVLVLVRTCSRKLPAEQITRHKRSSTDFDIRRVSKIPRD